MKRYVARAGPQKKLFDFGGNRDRVTLVWRSPI